VQKDCQERKLNVLDAVDRNRWRKLIKDVDDQERCEWMNVSSGTGSPETKGHKWLSLPPPKKEVMFLVRSVCLFVGLFVCLSVGFLANL